MEIHYVWVRNYGPLVNAGINLSSSLIINLTLDRDEKGKEMALITINRNKSYIDNFFNTPNVSNVTAIIGKNGSGKTSILKYIRNHMPKGMQAGMQGDIYVYTNKYTTEEEIVVFYPEAMKIKISGEVQKFNLLPYGEFITSDSYSIRNSDLAGVDFIYYSYFLDHQSAGPEYDGLMDISTTHLLTATRIANQAEIDLDEKVRDQFARTSDLTLLIRREVEKAVRFITEVPEFKPEFKLPEVLFLEFDDTGLLPRDDPKGITNPIGKALRDLAQQVPRSGDGSDLHELSLLLINTFLYDEKKYQPELKVSHEFNFNPQLPMAENVINFFRGLKSSVVDYKNKAIINNRYEILGERVPAFLDYLKELLAGNLLKPERGINKFYGYALELTEDSNMHVKKIMDLYFSVISQTSFLKFTWRSLSTGEQSFLSFMSRFYHVFNSPNRLRKNLVILIDEGDAGFHPEWQRKFFNQALKFFGQVFKDHSIQIVMTANTPFLSSDLPKRHVLFIKKNNGEGAIIQEKDNDRQHTFGANIHTLYSDAFYMEKLLIGDFAKEKIDTIISYLTNPEEKTVNEDYRKTIEEIGEPVIKRKLQTMWMEKFGLDEQITAMQKQLAELLKLKQMKG